MASKDDGKAEVCAWIRENFSKATILDVGACDGKWRKLLPEYTMDAVEIFPPNAEAIKPLYRQVFEGDVCDISYGHYDLIIFGDVIEHMTPARARAALEYAKPRCQDLIIGVPWLYKQDEIYGNPWEKHIQDDLTPPLFALRYKGFAVLYNAGYDYCYYHKEQNNGQRDKSV